MRGPNQRCGLEQKPAYGATPLSSRKCAAGSKCTRGTKGPVDVQKTCCQGFCQLWCARLPCEWCDREDGSERGSNNLNDKFEQRQTCTRTIVMSWAFSLSMISGVTATPCPVKDSATTGPAVRASSADLARFSVFVSEVAFHRCGLNNTLHIHKFVFWIYNAAVHTTNAESNHLRSYTAAAITFCGFKLSERYDSTCSKGRSAVYTYTVVSYRRVLCFYIIVPVCCPPMAQCATRRCDTRGRGRATISSGRGRRAFQTGCRQ